MGLPEVFYGGNNLIITNKDSNILLHFNCIDSLSYSSYNKRKAFLQEKGSDLFKHEVDDQMKVLMLQQSGLTDEEKNLNTIDIIPAECKVAQA